MNWMYRPCESLSLVMSSLLATVGPPVYRVLERARSWETRRRPNTETSITRSAATHQPHPDGIDRNRSLRIGIADEGRVAVGLGRLAGRLGRVGRRGGRRQRSQVRRIQRDSAESGRSLETHLKLFDIETFRARSYLLKQLKHV